MYGVDAVVPASLAELGARAELGVPQEEAVEQRLHTHCRFDKRPTDDPAQGDTLTSHNHSMMLQILIMKPSQQLGIPDCPS